MSLQAQYKTNPKWDCMNNMLLYSDHKLEFNIPDIIFLMENLTEQQYQLVLQFMQEANEDSFQQAAVHLHKYHFNLQNAINALNATSASNEEQLYEEEEMAKMKRYLLERKSKKQTKGNVKKKLEPIKKFANHFCQAITEKILPQIIKRKIIRSQFHLMYHTDAIIYLHYRQLEEAFFHAKNRKKHVLVIISGSEKSENIVKFLKMKKLLSYIEDNFIVFGALESELGETVLEDEQSPSIVLLRQNRYEQFEVLSRVSERQIPGLTEEQIKISLNEAGRKLNRERDLMQRTINFEGEDEMQQSRGNINRDIFAEVERQELNYVENVHKSHMIKEQNKVYEQIEKLTKKKEEEKRQREKVEEEKREERQCRKLSMPDEPSEGNIIKIIFRCPNGQMLNRNFLKEEKLELLYNWVQLNDDIEFEEEREFDLFYSYPPQSLGNRKDQPLEKIFEEDQEKIMIRQL